MNPHFPQGQQPIKLYRHPLSGHCHRVELMLALLDLPYETIDIDLVNGEHKTPEFLAISPWGQVPALEDNGLHLADSNAIIVYLEKKYNDGYDWIPSSPEGAAQVQRWLSIAAGEIFSGPCSVRLVKLFGMDLDYDLAKQKTETFFAYLEDYLADKTFLIDDAISLADVASYSYISHVPEGGVSLAPYPSIRAWLARIEEHPRFVGMGRSPEPNE